MILTYPSIKKTIILFLRIFLFALILSLPVIVLEIFNSELSSNMVFKTIYLSIVAILANVAGILYAVKKISKQEQFQLFNNISGSKLPYLLLAVLGTIAFSFLIDPLEKVLPFPDRYKQFFTILLSMKGYSFFVIVLIIPIVEEILFRGIILKGFLKNYSAFKAIILSSFFFGIIHFNLAQLTTAFLTGLFLGYLYWQTQSLSISIIAHIVFNAIFYFGFHFLDFGFSIESSISSTTIYLGLYFAAAIALTISILLIYQKSQRQQSEIVR